jgi:hypothetical protein
MCLTLNLTNDLHERKPKFSKNQNIEKASAIRGFFKVKKQMKSRKFAALFLSIVAIAVVSAPTYGHHGTGIAYDNTKPTVLKGTVTDFEWKNPHAQLFLDVKESDGKTLKWAVEMNSPGVMTRQGWTKREFSAGDTISITVYPAKSGALVGSCIGTCKVIINGVDQTPKPSAPGEQF